MSELIVFSRTSPCSYCDATKQLLDKHNLKYTEIVCDLDAETKKLFRKMAPNAKTVPQVFLDDILIGGYTDTKQKIFDIVGDITIEKMGENIG